MKTKYPAHIAVSEILKATSSAAVPGVTTLQLNEMGEALIKEFGVKSYNKGYKPKWASSPYPAAMCISVNNQIAHGVPGDYALQEGDLVSLDLGIIDSKGQCGDAALTVGVGEIANKHQKLLKWAKRILEEAIDEVGPNVSTQVITDAIWTASKRYGYTVNRSLCGHAIGKKMHMEPRIYNSPEPGNVYEVLKVGQIICIEPMITEGRDDIGVVGVDGWSKYTTDGKFSAFFEHMVEVTEKGYNVLTTHI